jgi:MATE family multidrug resistance protein
MASYTVMQFIDAAMLSHVGSGVDEPTAAGNAGMISFSVISLGMGVLFIIKTLVSQHFGQRDYKRCGQYLAQGVWFSLIFGALALCVVPLAGAPFRALHHEASLAALETTYLRIVLAASVFKLVGTSVGQFLLAINRPMAVLMATLAGVGVNAVAAWVLIFGHAGVAGRGVAGAAWAQNIGVLGEMGVLIALALRPAVRRRYGVLDLDWRWDQMKTLLRVGLPSGLQVVADVLAWSMFAMWVMNQFGTKAMAANTFMFRYRVVSFMPAFGISTAVTALVGRYIGMGRNDLARHCAHLGFKVAAVYMVACGLFFFLGRHDLIRFFSHDPVVVREGAALLIFAAIYQFLDALYINYNGALRGAGDTLVPAVATGALCWTITVFGGYWVARTWPQWGPIGPWLAATTYGLILGAFMFLRFHRGRWELIRLEQQEPPGTVAREVVVANVK